MTLAITVDPRFVATRELLARATRHVTVADIERHAPSDPGYPKYVAAFTAILHDKEAALSREFAVTETIGLTRWTHAPSSSSPTAFRWFRIMTSAAQILIDDEEEGLNYGVATLLVDAFALGDAAIPFELLSAVCREIVNTEPTSCLEEDHAFCVLGELLVASARRLDHATIEALCAELELRDRRFQRWWEFEDGDEVDQPKTDAFVWSLTCFDQLHPVWLDLVAQWFPTAPPVAATMKQRLLSDGARWADGRRPMS